MERAIDMLRCGALPFAMAMPLACAAGNSVFASNHPHALHSSGGILTASASQSTRLAAGSLRYHHEEDQDQIFLLNTRAIGTRCESDAMCSGLVCEAYAGLGGAFGWESLSWEQLAAELAKPTPTIIYIHGNRVDCGYSKSHGLAMYRSLANRRQDDGPIRFIIWSWPSSQIRGQVRDYQVKAARTKQVGWQLAWAIDQLPSETPIAVIGYSYGARVASGALHLLAGGRLGSLELNERVHPQRPPVRAAFVAAALDANWIRPGGYHGRALEQIDELLLVNNHLDPAMRFYHLAMESGARPLGYGGPRGLGQFAGRVRSVDVTGAVGRHHAIEEYLASSNRVTRVLEQVAQFPARLHEEQRETETELAARP
ncbi:alpha/beta hydrolase family protein [Lacipirellula limnantheis]|nr:hypothetical protein [Lacipirellula limnantheis]